MMRMTVGTLALALLAGACSQPAEAPAEEAAAPEDSEPMALTPVDTPPDADSASLDAPELAPVSRAEIEAELEPGAGCSLEDDGKLLLVAVEGDAIARPNGTLRHFAFDGDLNALWDGGVFTAGAITITVERSEGEGERIDEVTSWPAVATVAEEGRSSDAVYEAASWECGT